MRFLIFMLTSALVMTSCKQAEISPVDPAPYRQWESHSVQSHGIRLHYWRTGGDKPVLVMAHGITDFGLNWASFAAKFEHEFDIIMYDARGHGFSQKPKGDYSLSMHMEDLHGLLIALDIHKPVLMGHSMGGSTVALFAATYADVPTAIILEDPPMEEALENLTEEMLPDWKAWVAQQVVTPKDRLMHLARTEYHPGWPSIEYDLWAESKRLVVPDVINILQGDGFGKPRELFAKITAPTLILKADANEENRKRHQEAASLLGNGTLVHIDGAGHLIRLDKPAEAEQHIRDFLSNIDPPILSK